MRSLQNTSVFIELTQSLFSFFYNILQKTQMNFLANPIF